MICSLVGVPDEDNEQVRAWNDDILYLEEGSTEQGGERGARAMAAFYEYIGALAAEKRARPQEDLLSVLAGSELELEDGTTRLLSDAELVEYVILVTSRVPRRWRASSGTPRTCLPNTPAGVAVSWNRPGSSRARWRNFSGTRRRRRSRRGT